MRIIDFYIIRRFFKIFFFSLFLFTLVAVAIDTSEKIDRFYASGKSFWEIVSEYHLGFIPFILVLLFPIFIFISVVFFTSRMALHSEIIAIRSLGMSYTRLLYPYIGAGIFFMLVHWSLYNYIIPVANEIRTDFLKKHMDKIDKSLSKYYAALYFKGDERTYVTFKNYNVNTQHASPFTIDIIDSNRLVTRHKGSSISWSKDSSKWVGRRVHTMEHAVAYQREIAEIFHDTIYFTLAFTPNDAIFDGYYKDKLTRPELAQYIEEQRLKGTDITSLQLELFKRDATPFSVLLLVVLGVLMSSIKVRGGSGMHIALGFVLMSLYILADKFSGSFAVKGSFPPILAAWTPNVIFFFITLFVYRRTVR